MTDLVKMQDDILTVRRAAGMMLKIGTHPMDQAVGEWLAAEADHAQQMVTKVAAVNVLLTLADNANEVEARLTVAYSTFPHALNVARTYLRKGEDDG